MMTFRRESGTLYNMFVVGSNMQDINVLKRKLANSFAMKDLGVAKQILRV